MQKGKPIPIVYLTTAAKLYKKTFIKNVLQAVKDQNWNLPVNATQHFYVDATYYLDRLDKDPSNYEKCLCDSITATHKIWEDDNVVCYRVQRIYYDSINPRIEIVIHPVDYIGIFDNIAQLEEFKSRCFSCTRYKRNCSLLEKAKQGRIQEENNSTFCSKFKQLKQFTV